MFALLLAHSFALAGAPSTPTPPTPPSYGDQAPSDESGGSEEDGMMRRWNEIAAQLGLDDSQRDSIEKLYYDSRMTRVDLQGKEEKARIELERQMMKDPMDEKAVYKALDAQCAADAEIRRNRLQLQLGIRKVLSKEQWEQLAELRESRKSGRGGGGMGGGMRPRPPERSGMQEE